MGKIVKLETYRRAKKKAYLKDNKSNIESFVRNFVEANVELDFWQVAQDYQSQSTTASWDYIDLREIIRESFVKAFAPIIDHQLTKESWYDSQLTNIEEIIDRCVSAHIINQCEYAITKV